MLDFAQPQKKNSRVSIHTVRQIANEVKKDTYL